LTASYITPYALTLQATTQQIGYLASIPTLMTMLLLLWTPLLTERAGSRKAFLIPVDFIQALTWLPILGIPILFHTNQVLWLIAFFSLSTVAAGIMGTPWSAMMADLVPPEVRGSYFGLRNGIGNLVTLIFSFVAGGLLQIFTGNTRLAFTIIFVGSTVGRLISLYFLSLTPDPHPALSVTAPRKSIPQIARGLFSTNIGRFITFIIFFNVTQNIAAPFFGVYLLRELKINYINYQIINAIPTIVTMLIVTWWGKHADKAGNIKVLYITALMIPLVPILWTINSSTLWLCTAQVYSGFALAGFNLCAGLFIWDAAPQENRTRYITLFAALSALGSTQGALIGGNIGPHLPQISGSYFLTIFLLSGVLRLIVVIALFRHISEVRDVPRIKTTELLFAGLRPAALHHWWRKISNGKYKKNNPR
jgi:MFS family permease